MKLILASQSPRRQQLMQLFRRPFSVCIADVDETMDPGGDPYDQVARVSRAKAEAISREAEDIIVAADTIVVCDNRILGKPHTEGHAAAMLRLLSGRQHQVMTGLTVLRGEQSITCTQVTDIRFRELSEEEILSYIATGEPMDKAGAYGIQGGGALFAEEIQGDYYNVMGLPVCKLGQILRQVAPDWMEEPQ